MDPSVRCPVALVRGRRAVGAVRGARCLVDALSGIPPPQVRRRLAGSDVALGGRHRRSHPCGSRSGTCTSSPAAIPTDRRARSICRRLTGAPSSGTSLGPDGIVRHGSEGDVTVVTGGRFTFADDVSDMLLGLLPPVVHIPAASPAAAPLRATLDIVGFETGANRPGARVVNGASGHAGPRPDPARAPRFKERHAGMARRLGGPADRARAGPAP